MSLDVDAAPACPPGELGVLPRGDVHHGLAVVLDQFLQHDGPGGHVDAERQGFGGEDQFAGPGGESLLHDRLESGQLPGVMGGDPRAEGAPEVLVAERVQVGDRQSADVPVGDLAEQGGLIAGGQVHPGGEQLLDGGVAPGAAEDEPDRGQQPGPLQDPRHLGPRGAVPREPRMDVTAEGTGAAGSLPPAGTPAGPPGVVAHPGGLGAGDLQQLPVHLRRPLAGQFPGGRGDALEQVHQFRSHQHLLVEGDGTSLGDHHLETPPHGAQPVAEVLHVADGRRQRRDLHPGSQPEDDLLPHGTAEPVGQIVHLVHDDVAQVVQPRRGGVDHVAQHLGGHHHHLGVAVDRGIARQQPHPVRAVPRHEVVVLLVAQRLDRGGVEASCAGLQGQPHGELPHHRLARPGGRGHQHPRARGQSLAAGDLVVVERKGVERGEALHLIGHRPKVAGRLRRRRP